MALGAIVIRISQLITRRRRHRMLMEIHVRCSELHKDPHNSPPTSRQTLCKCDFFCGLAVWRTHTGVYSIHAARGSNIFIMASVRVYELWPWTRHTRPCVRTLNNNAVIYIKESNFLYYSNDNNKSVTRSAARTIHHKANNQRQANIQMKSIKIERG